MDRKKAFRNRSAHQQCPKIHKEPQKAANDAVKVTETGRGVWVPLSTVPTAFPKMISLAK